MSEESRTISLSETCDRLSAPTSVLILTHMRPDADTLGSAFALKRMLESLGKRCEVVCDDDEIPKRLRFLTGADCLRPETLPADFAPELVVSVDVSASKLLGRLEAEYAPRVGLAIDHHALGTPFAPETLLMPFGACGEIIFDLSKEWKARGKDVLDRTAATALYAAVCSDTGSFKFDSVTAETHLRIAALHRLGINHAEIARRLYDSRPISQIMATKVALNNLHFYADNRVAVINFTTKMRVDNGLTREDIDDIISLTRSIEGVEVGMSIKQSDTEPTLYKVSMRSNRVVDVSKLCAVFGGGGHVRAGGCTVNAENELAAEEVLIREIEAELARLDEEGAFENAGEL